jgi:hypothetical protein
MPDAMTAVLSTFRSDRTQGWSDAWVGMEPTFQTKRSIRGWEKAAGDPAAEDRYFLGGYMQRTLDEMARAIERKYDRKARGRAAPWCMFARVRREVDRDQWDVPRHNLIFEWAQDGLEPFVARATLDPETFEYSIKPVPLAWFYDERFVEFLERFLWGTPLKLGLTPSIAHGGAQFSLSAKTYLTGTLLADDIATKLNHPELATWTLDWPNPDDRAFRATRDRFAAFRKVLEQYWAGAFHPRATGPITALDVYQDRTAFEPAAAPPPGLVDALRGPAGDARDVFQNNFVFGRAVRLRAQAVEPGYWQSAHPKEDGYRPDQIMRYSEGNLNRLQLSGEFHVKSGKVLHPESVPEADARLDLDMLAPEASWENRAQMARTSARDFVEALLLDVHHARWLQEHPGVRLKPTLLQDQILGDAARTIERHGGAAELARLRVEARAANLEASRGRIKSDWIEPEALLWAAWRRLPAGERAAIAVEAIEAFVERVEQAASADPRPAAGDRDPMEAHRHRVHPLLWAALEATPGTKGPVARRELGLWQARREDYLARRPVYSQTGAPPPWEGV